MTSAIDCVRLKPEEPRVFDADARTVALFAFMWAVFTFFHQSKHGYWTRTPIESLQTAAAIFVLFRPTSLAAFLSLALIQLADLVYSLPNITNHSIFALFVNLTIICAAGVHALRGEGRLAPGSLLRLFAPVVRTEVIVLYFYVVLHKLNTDFFSPVSSCAVDHTLHLSGLGARLTGMSLIPDLYAIRIALIAGTLIAEAAIPLLLVWRKTRIAGVALGLVFHYILGINIYHDFSGMIFALYLLFLPANFAACAFEWWEQMRRRIGVAVHRISPRNAVFGTAGLTVVCIGVLLLTGNTWRMLHPIFFVIWVVYGIAVIVAFGAVVYSWRGRFCHTAGEFRGHPALLFIPVLVFLNGLTPYIGLKTENSFAMFSNLRTEGGRTNHLFIPGSVQIFGFQKDLVTIGSSTNVYLQYFAQQGTAIPYFVLRNQISSLSRKGVKNVMVTYTHGGVSAVVTNAETHPELSAPYPWILRKFLKFREVNPAGPQMCRH